MLKINIGLAYDYKEVVASEEATIREVYTSNGLGGLLNGNYSINGKSITTVADKTLGEMGVNEGDFLVVTENHKSAR